MNFLKHMMPWLIAAAITGAIGMALVSSIFPDGFCDCDPIVPDSQVVAYHLVGTITLEGDSLGRADFNGDGVVNGLDLILTLRGEE